MNYNRYANYYKKIKHRFIQKLMLFPFYSMKNRKFFFNNNNFHIFFDYKIMNFRLNLVILEL